MLSVTPELKAGARRAEVAAFVERLWRNRSLVRELTVRDLRGGHAAHSFGALWVFAQPLVVVFTFMVIFGVVMGSRMATTAQFPGDYTSYILIGLVPWLLMQNILSRAPSVFLANANLVKQVVFPVETLPVATVLAGLATFLPALIVMVVYKLAWGGGLTALALTLPFILAAQCLLGLGITLMLSVVTPFLRDIREFVLIYITVAVYFTPAIYLPDWAPALLRPLLYLNPFSYVVWTYQDALFFGEIRHGIAWVVFAILTVLSLASGFAVFRRIRPVLGNVL